MAIDWRHDPQAAFAEARAGERPLLLYWGAAWCPPCNRIKAVIFERPDFLALAGSFVALAIDGDSPGAQQLAEQLKLRSYPTLVVYRPDGAEVTRLPSELDGKRFVHILELALNARFTVAESLSVALSRERKLSDDEWRLLSFYSWDTDERQLLKNLDFAAIVASLTRACTLADATVRLEWLGLHAAAMAGETGIDQAAAISRLETTLGDAGAVCLQLDIVIGYALDLVRFLTAPGSAARMRLVASWSHALAGLEQDDTLNLCDRLGALRTRVRLTRLGTADPQLALLAGERVAAAAAALPMSPVLRHAVINTGAGILADAGSLADAQALLNAELAASHSPFFFMHTLAAIAKRRGDPAAALDWYEQAWMGAVGPATRLQWGATYLLALVDLAPRDQARIERCAAALLAEFAAPDAPFQRNRSQAARIVKVLSSRDDLGEHAVALVFALRHQSSR